MEGISGVFFFLLIIGLLLFASGCASTQSKQTASVSVDDKVITATIKSRHAESTDIMPASISVETLYGVVLLSGFAKNQEEKMAAEYIAHQVQGVKSVHNAIVIHPCMPSCKPAFDDQQKRGSSVDYSNKNKTHFL